MVERSKLLGCSCWQPGWLEWWGDQEAEGGGTSTIRPLSQQARCVLTLLCRVRLLATTVVLSSDLSLCYCCCVYFLSVISSPSSSLSFCLFSFILTRTLFLFLSFMVPLSPLPSQAHPLFSPPPLPAHASHSVARIMTLLTTQTHGGSGYGPAKSSKSLTSIKSLAPLFSLGWVRETAKRKGCLAAWGLRYVTSMILTFSVTLSIFHIYIYLQGIQNILTSSAPEKCQQLECTCLNGAGGM